MAAAPEDALTGFLEVVGMQGSPSHQWERLVLGRQEQASADRPVYSKSFCFPSTGFHISSSKSEDKPQLTQNTESWRRQEVPLPVPDTRIFPFPSFSGSAFQAHVPHTETPKHLVIPACDCATMPTTPARVGKGKQQKQEAEITKFKRPLFRKYFGF